ncbi:MAG: thioredoxin-disulfide reductase [Anaerolineae bacterium]|nr:thioredoxin-disulfide reductase [Anaerolineae bacterium]
METNQYCPEGNREQIQTRLLILGGGPAGFSAAIYAARAELTPILLTGTALGGQAATTDMIENYPGFPEGINGLELGTLFQQQAERFGAQVVYDSITSVDFSEIPFRLCTYDKEYLAESVVISTGARPNHLNVPGETELTGKGVSYCGTCDGWFFRGKHVVVVGGGDSALEEALFLTRYASKVTVVHRRDSLRAGKLLQKRAFGNPKIEFIWNTVLTEIVGAGEVKQVALKNLETCDERLFDTDGVFIFIGHTPNVGIFGGQLALDENGYIQIDRYMRTSIPGVFAGGEVADHRYRQVITSSGMGAAAAIEAIKFLEEKETEKGETEP